MTMNFSKNSFGGGRRIEIIGLFKYRLLLTFPIRVGCTKVSVKVFTE